MNNKQESSQVRKALERVRKETKRELRCCERNHKGQRNGSHQAYFHEGTVKATKMILRIIDSELSRIEEDVCECEHEELEEKRLRASCCIECGDIIEMID